MERRAHRAVRHGARAPRHGHDGLALAADRRQRAVQRERGRARQGQAARRAPARGERRRHRAARRRAGSAWPACRRARCRGPSWRAPRTTRVAAGPTASEAALVAELDFNQGEATLPVRRARRGRRGRHRDGPGRAASATSPSTTAAGSSTRCSSPASSTAGSRRASAQALYEGVVYDDDGNPLTANLMDYAMPSAAELPSFEAIEHRDADAAEPARREGHRRVGHDRLDARGAERGRRRAVAPRHPPHRHAAHRGAGLARDPGRAHDQLTPVAFASPMLRLTPQQYRRIVAHCYAGAPDEACGLLGGLRRRRWCADGQGHRGVPVPQRRRVGADVHGRLAATTCARSRDAEARGDEIVGVWHSHTHTDAYPSPTDVRQARRPRAGCTSS